MPKGKGRTRSVAVAGWREWVSLPGLGIPSIKAKLDTGARSSSLHAFDLQFFERQGRSLVRFRIHPQQRSAKLTVEAEAEVTEFRLVKSSSGVSTRRPVIVTELEMLGERWPIELTLANRDQMGFRMLLGRQALRRRCLVDSGRSYFGGRSATRSAVVKPSTGAEKKPRKGDLRR